MIRRNKETKKLDEATMALAGRSLKALNIPVSSGLLVQAALIIAEVLEEQGVDISKLDDINDELLDEKAVPFHNRTAALLISRGFQPWNKEGTAVSAELPIGIELPVGGFEIPHFEKKGGKFTRKEPIEFVEVEPGIKVAKHLIDESTSHPEPGTDPRDHDSHYNEQKKERSRQLSQLHEDLRKDLEISKKVTASIVEKQMIGLKLKDNAESMLSDSLQRQRDKAVAFVNVTDERPKDAARRVLRTKDAHPEWEVEPIDLTGVLDDTKPLVEHHIEALHPIMHVKKHADTDSLPEEIRFAVPSVSLPVKEGVMDDGTYVVPGSTPDVTYDLQRYVHLDSMPDELKSVIRLYLSMRRGTAMNVTKYFKEAVEKLHDVSQKLPDDASDKLPRKNVISRDELLDASGIRR